MKKYVIAVMTISIVASCVPAAFAWTNHAVIAYMALRGMPELDRTCSAEPIESFLRKEKTKLGAVLEEEELWARKNIREYSPRPDSLRFFTNAEDDIVVRFLNALRLNPDMKLTLFVQPCSPNDSRAAVAWSKISLYPRNYLKRPIVALYPNEKVKAVEVIATASDEPDYGYDMGLYEDNGTPYGSVYGYGKQPISDPKVFEYSQAGFHMGFYHESWIVFKAAPILKKTCPEERAHLFYTLSKFAFETGHVYWGCRFAGMGMHYIMDLSQPYHACTLPGVSTAKLLWLSFLDVLGFHAPYTHAVANVTNEHILIETLVYDRMLAAFDGGLQSDPLLSAMTDMSLDSRLKKYDGHYITDVISQEAYNNAGDVVDALNSVIADRTLFNKTAELDSSGKFAADAVVVSSSEKSKRHFWDVINSIMRSTGSYSRIYMKAALGNVKI